MLMSRPAGNSGNSTTEVRIPCNKKNQGDMVISLSMKSDDDSY